MDDDFKKCSKCKKSKPITEFYISRGKRRSECKPCTIRNNTRYQKRLKAWKNRFVGDEKRSYMVEYYAKNKEKFAEYRRVFKEKHPSYYKEYSRKRK